MPELSLDFKNNIKNVSFSFLIGGIAILLLTLSSYTYNSIMGAMFGYSTIIFGILLLGIMTYSNINTEKEPSYWRAVVSIFSIISPFMIFLIILILSIVLMNLYLQKLITSEVPKLFKSFNVTSVVLIITQACLLIYNIKNTVDKPNENTSTSPFSSKIENAKLRLLGFVNLIVLFTSFICIKYLATDG